MKKLVYLSCLAAFVLAGCKQSTPTTVYSKSQKDAILDNIQTRRAVRKYKDKQVSKEQIDTIMKCAIFAPSALNKQPWEIRVVRKPEILQEINNRFLKYAEGKDMKGSAAHYKEPGFSVFHGAPTLVVIARDKSNDYSMMDCGSAMQNILLSAHALGLGTCPIGSLVPVFNLPENKDVLELLNIPKDYAVAISLALGYADEQPTAPQRYPDRVKIIE
ncbi:MAG: nitroreductase [Bacteroides sp.]|jgi:nitroreductase|nr:nitroreductase [Bacteroides sp.]